jgi:putative ABC transport system permease protein
MHAWIEHTLQDLRYSLRGLRRNPGFTLTAVLAAAIAIGATTAVFSAVDRILFRPLPYRDEARLVSAGMMAPLATNEFLLADAYFDLRRNPGPFAAVTSFQAGAIACDLTENSPLRMRCLRIEANFLDTLGVRLAAGRPFTAEEDRPNGPRVAIVSDALWRSRFAGDPGAIGKTLSIDDTPTRIAGVLPPDFVMPTLTHADILLPEALDEARERQGRALRVFARLRPGVTLPQAQSALQPYFARMMETVPPRFRKEVTLRVRPLRDRQVGDARAASLALLGAVIAVLLIACANIANLLLARAVGRDREIAVRAALGASRARLMRLALAESLLLAIAGGAAGCGLAWVLLRTLQAIAPEGLPRIGEATVDLRVLLFSAAAAVLCGILFGLFPALRRTEGGVLGSARTVGPARGWLRGALVTTQIAISVVLLTSAGLLLRSLDNLQRVPMGFESNHVITASFVLGRQRYSRDVEQLALFRELKQLCPVSPPPLSAIPSRPSAEPVDARFPRSKWKAGRSLPMAPAEWSPGGTSPPAILPPWESPYAAAAPSPSWIAMPARIRWCSAKPWHASCSLARTRSANTFSADRRASGSP